MSQYHDAYMYELFHGGGRYHIETSPLICSANQHLSNIWSSIQEKVKQHWGWVEKNRVLIIMFHPVIISSCMIEITHLSIKRAGKVLSLVVPANIFLFKINNKTITRMCENMFKVDDKDTRTIFLMLFCCLYW